MDKKIKNLIKNTVLKSDENFGNIAINDILEKDSCICNLIYNKKSMCKCNNLHEFNKQGKSGAKIFSAICKNNKTKKYVNDTNYILKTQKLKINNFKLFYKTLINKPNNKRSTKKINKSSEYNYIKVDRFLLQPIINQIIHKYIPNNSINFDEYGICKNNKEQIGFIKMPIAKLGDLSIFINDLLDNNLFAIKINNSIDYISNNISTEKDFTNIDNIEMKKKIFHNVLCQIVFSLSLLQLADIEFYHSDFKLANIFVKPLSIKEVPYFTYKIYNKKYKIPNIGIAALIVDLDLSSITLNIENNYCRLVPKTNFLIDVEKMFKKISITIIEKFKNINRLEKIPIKFKDILNYKILNKNINTYISFIHTRYFGISVFRFMDIYYLLSDLFHNIKINKFMDDINYKHNEIFSILPDKLKEILSSEKSNTYNSYKNIITILKYYDDTNTKPITPLPDNYLDKIII